MVKKIVSVSLLTVVGILGISQTAFADNATLSVVPTSLNAQVDKTVNVAVQLQSAGNKVCVVSGVLNFTNLQCQGITMASGVMAQMAPTCQNPKFLIGIPQCTTGVQNLLSVSMKGMAAGQANLSFSSVKVIGAGTDVSFVSQGGLYSIFVPVVQKVVLKPNVAPATPIAKVVNLFDVAAQVSLKSQSSVAPSLMFILLMALITLTLIVFVAAMVLWIRKRVMVKKLNDFKANKPVDLNNEKFTL